MRAIGVSVLALAALGAGECRAVEWEINLESNLRPDLGMVGDYPAGYRADVSGDRLRLYSGESKDLLRTEALLRPSAAGAMDWEIGLGASLRPAGRIDEPAPRTHRGLGNFDGSLTLRATIRPRSSRP